MANVRVDRTPGGVGWVVVVDWWWCGGVEGAGHGRGIIAAWKADSPLSAPRLSLAGNFPHSPGTVAGTPKNALRRLRP